MIRFLKKYILICLLMATGLASPIWTLLFNILSQLNILKHTAVTSGVERVIHGQSQGKDEREPWRQQMHTDCERFGFSRPLGSPCKSGATSSLLLLRLACPVPGAGQVWNWVQLTVLSPPLSSPLHSENFCPHFRYGFLKTGVLKGVSKFCIKFVQ